MPRFIWRYRRSKNDVARRIFVAEDVSYMTIENAMAALPVNCRDCFGHRLIMRDGYINMTVFETLDAKPLVGKSRQTR